MAHASSGDGDAQAPEGGGAPVAAKPERGLDPGRHAARPLLASLPHVFALHDILLLAYLVVVSWLVSRAPLGAEKETCARDLFLSFAVVVVGCVVRAQTGLSPRLRAGVYRVALAGALLWNYLMLRGVLPLLRPDSVDDALLAIDLRLFGVEPALWMERWNRPNIVEWFAFFYFSYFFICLTYLLVVVWLSKLGRVTGEFSMGTLIVFCFGELGYIAVPAYGPIRHLASSYAGPVAGGFFWRCVSETVEAGSAMKDVFPSLHTAVPTWFTIYAFHRARTDRRWLWPARITGFFAANIVVSTLLLRWHYAIDVVAGLCLASLAGFGGLALCAAESRWRARHGVPEPWSFEPAKPADARAPVVVRERHGLW